MYWQIPKILCRKKLNMLNKHIIINFSYSVIQVKHLCFYAFYNISCISCLMCFAISFVTFCVLLFLNRFYSKLRIFCYTFCEGFGKNLMKISMGFGVIKDDLL